MKRLVAATLALALTAAACGGDDAADSTEVAEPTPAETVEAEPTATPEPEQDEAPTEDVIETSAFVADAEVLTAMFSPVEPGTYRVDTLGTPFSITLEGEWFVQPNGGGHTVLSDPGSQGPGDADIAFFRPSGLSDPTDVGALPEDSAGWDVFDIAGWLGALPDGVGASDAADTTIGGRDAVTFDVQIVDESVCGPFFCAGFVGNAVGDGRFFDPGFAYRIWWVDMGEFEPLVIHVGVEAGDEAFLETAEAALSTLAFGEPAPHPVPTVDNPWEIGFGGLAPAGVVQLPVAGGIAFESDIERDVFLMADGHASIALSQPLPGDVEILTPTTGPDGTPIGTVDDVIAAIEALGGTLEAAGTAELGLGEAQVFDLTSSGGPPSEDGRGLVTSADAEFGWQPPAFARVWVTETDRGVVMATAESFVGDEALEAALELAETVVPSLHLIDMPDGMAATDLTDLILDGEPSGDGALAVAGNEVVTDALAVPLSLTVPVDTALVDELPGLIGFGAPGATRGENVLTAVFESTGIPGPTPEAPPSPLPDDVGSYVEGITGLEILDMGVDTISGVDAPWWDLTVAEGAAGTFECSFGNCLPLLAHDTFGSIVAGDEWRFRLWSIPEPDGQVFALTQATPDRFDGFASFSAEVLSGLRVLPVPAEVEPADPFDLAGIESSPELEPGRYFADLLPMPFAIEIASPVGLDIALPSFIGFTNGQGSGIGFQGVAILEPVNGLADPADIGGPEGPPESWVPVPDDLTTWVDQIPQLEVLDSGQRTISGFDAPWVDIAVVGAADRRGDCGMPCLVLFDFAFGPWVATEEAPQRIHTVRHPAGTIFVIVEAEAAAFADWVAEAEALVDGIELGG